MSIFKKVFDWDFFGNKAKERIKVLEAKNESLLELSAENYEQSFFNAQKPYKNIIYSNGIITVIFNDGSIISAAKPVDVVELVKIADNESQIITLLTVQEIKPQIDNNNEENENIQKFAKYKEEVLELLGTDFSCTNSLFFYKNISLPINSLILNSLIEHKKNNNVDEYNALLSFFLWLTLNPIESAREDTMRFIKNNNIPLDANGLLITFRKVVTVKDTNTELSDYISEQFFKKKRHKKSPKNYTIWKNIENNELFCKKEVPNLEDTFEILGNLNDLYFNLENDKSVYYTDNHTKKKKIVFGTIYKENEDKVDLDNTKDCSKGLHSGSVTFGEYDAFGDVGAICLLNPSKIRSVPLSNVQKLRSSELFMVCPTNFSNYEELVNSKELLNFSDIYAKESTEELEIMLSEKRFDNIVVQENI